MTRAPVMRATVSHGILLMYTCFCWSCMAISELYRSYLKYWYSKSSLYLFSVLITSLHDVIRPNSIIEIKKKEFREYNSSVILFEFNRRVSRSMGVHGVVAILN